MIGSPTNAGGVASSQGAGGAGLQNPGGQQRFQNLNIMSRRKSGAASGAVVSGNASQNQADIAQMIRSNRGKLTTNTADSSDQQQ